MFGSMLVHYAVMWYILLQTQSGLMMTVLAVAGALPMFFISPFGGVWADRYNKKAIINIADASVALVTLVMAVLFSLGIELIWPLLICLVIRAFGQGVQMPAVNALVPELVPPEHLTRANGISGSVMSMVMFASPMAGGALLAVAPIQTLMFVDVVSAAIGISILVFFVKVPIRAEKKEITAGARQYFVEIGEGLRYIAGKTFLKRLLVLSALYSIMSAPGAMLTPLQVARNWGEDIWYVAGGFALGAEQRLASIEIAFSVGMVLGGIIIGAWGGFKNRTHTCALSISLFGLGAVGLGLIGNFWVYVLCMGAVGVVMSLFNAPMMATLQINVDAEYMGRVFSVLAMMGSLMMPLGMILWGPLSDVVAIDWLLVGTGCFVFLMGFLIVLDKTLLKAGAEKA